MKYTYLDPNVLTIVGKTIREQWLTKKVDKEEGKSLISEEDLNKITVNGTALSALADTVGTLNTSLLSANQSIEALTPRVEKNETSITSLQTDKVDKVEGQGLISDEKLALIDTNAEGIATNSSRLDTLETNKVDKVEGSSLVEDEKITQIDTNKESIASLTTKLNDYALTTALESGLKTKANQEDFDSLSTQVGNKVDKEEGKSLVSSTDITQITTNKLAIESINEKIPTLATTQSVESVIELVNKIGVFKGTTESSNLESLKESANVGDTYIVTDENDHWYVFCGVEQAGQNGINENGFYDLGNHIDLSPYAKAADLEKKVDKVEGKELVATDSITQIESNKSDIATLKTDVESLKTQGADSEQVTTNKNNITDLQTRVTTLETQLNQLLTTLNNWV